MPLWSKRWRVGAGWHKKVADGGTQGCPLTWSAACIGQERNFVNAWAYLLFSARLQMMTHLHVAWLFDSLTALPEESR